MSIPVTVDELNAFTRQYLVEKSTDVVYKDSILFAMMLGKQRINISGGSYIQRPIMYGKLNGGFYSKGATFNTAYVKTDAAFTVNWKFAHVNVTLYGEDDVLNRGREAAFSIVEMKMANASMRMAEILTQAFYQDGQSSAADAVTSAGVLSTNESFDGLLAWIDDGNDYSSYSSATDITKSFATIGGLTRSDLFTTAPTFNSAKTPVAGLAGANAYVDRGFTTFSLNTINEACSNTWYGNRNVDTILCREQAWNKFFNALQPNQRFTDGNSSNLAKIGFKSFRFNTADVSVDKYMPAQLMLGLNTDYVEMYVTDNAKYQMGFTGFKEMPNSTMISGQFLFAGNLMVPNARTSFKLVGAALA